MKPLTTQQKKAGWIIAAILLLVHFAPGIISNVRHEFGHTSKPVLVKPNPPISIPDTPPAAVEAAANPQLTYAKFMGIWVGSELTPDQYICNIKLEVRPSEEETGKVTGFETRTCIPSLLMRAKPKSIDEVLRAASPLSAMMTGSLNDGDLSFRVDKSVGTPSDHCPISGYSVSPFGQGQLMAQWEQNSCDKSGHMLLHKGRG